MRHEHQIHPMCVEERWHVHELIVGANGDAEPTQRCVDVGAAPAREHIGFRVRLARATRDFARGRADNERVEEVVSRPFRQPPAT
jgi:hypothetical protein